MKKLMMNQMVAIAVMTTAGVSTYAADVAPVSTETIVPSVVAEQQMTPVVAQKAMPVTATQAVTVETVQPVQPATAETTEQEVLAPIDLVGKALDNAIWPTDNVTVPTANLKGALNPTIDAIVKATGETPVSPVVSTSTVPAQYVSPFTAESLAPYVGKQIVSVTVSPVPDRYKEQVEKILFSRPGDTISKETIENDITVLGNLGVFSEITPTFQAIPEGVQVVYVVTPNPIVKSVSVEGSTIYSKSQLESFLDVPKGEVLNTVLVGAKLQAIDAAYSRDGYMLARVNGVQVLPTGDIRISITEGIVESIETQGNTKTKKRVITREMVQKENTPFNKYLARRSVQNVYNTGYFEDVNIRLLPGSTPDRTIIEIDVAEQRTGSVSIGAGYSENNGFVGILGLSEKNFRGTGDKVDLYWEFGGDGSDGKNYRFNYMRPWLDDKGTSASLSIFNRKDEYSDYQSDGSTYSEYDRKSTGGNITFGRQTGVFSREYLTLESRKDTWVEHVSGYDYSQDPQYLKDNFGKTNSVTFQRVFDSRDNIYDPTSGKRISYSAQYAGLGGDFDFEKVFAEFRTYKKVGHSHVLAFKVSGGVGFGDIPYSQLYTVGGSDTLRGYEDDQFRGRKYYNASLEYRFPIFNKVQGVLFADVGSAWDAPTVPWHDNGSKFNVGVGPGLRIQTPLGPIRLDYGYGKDGGKFSFAFGGQF